MADEQELCGTCGALDGHRADCPDGTEWVKVTEHGGRVSIESSCLQDPVKVYGMMVAGMEGMFRSHMMEALRRDMEKSLVRGASPRDIDDLGMRR